MNWTLLCSCADLIRWEGFGTQKCSSSFLCYQPATIGNVNILFYDSQWKAETLLIKYFLAWLFPAASEMHQVWIVNRYSLAKWLAECRGHALHPGAAENAAVGETAEMIVMPVLISRIKIADITDLAFPHGKDPQRSAAPGLVLQLEQPARQHHPPFASISRCLGKWGALAVVCYVGWGEKLNLSSSLSRWLDCECSQSGGKQIWSKYERNPTEKYSWVKIPNERKNFPKLEEERRKQPERRKTNMKQIWKKSNWEILLSWNPKWEEELSQTGGRQKSSSTAAPNALVRGWSMRKCEFTCWEGQFCAELSTFNENFCRNLPWKINSPLSGHSFSRPTSTSGSGNLTRQYLACIHISWSMYCFLKLFI